MHSFALVRRMHQHLLWLFIKVSNMQRLNTMLHIINIRDRSIAFLISICDTFLIDIDQLKSLDICNFVYSYQNIIIIKKKSQCNKNLLKSWHMYWYIPKMLERKKIRHNTHLIFHIHGGIVFYVQYFVGKWFLK